MTARSPDAVTGTHDVAVDDSKAPAGRSTESTPRLDRARRPAEAVLVPFHHLGRLVHALERISRPLRHPLDLDVGQWRTAEVRSRRVRSTASRSPRARP